MHCDKLGTGVTAQGGIDLFSTAGISMEWEVPFGQHYSTVAALATQRYKYETGTTDEQLSAVCVSNRKWAELNPNAFFRKPLTIEEVMASKMLSTPLRAKHSNMLFDGGARVHRHVRASAPANSRRGPPTCSARAAWSRTSPTTRNPT